MLHLLCPHFLSSLNISYRLVILFCRLVLPLSTLYSLRALPPFPNPSPLQGMAVVQIGAKRYLKCSAETGKGVSIQFIFPVSYHSALFHDVKCSFFIVQPLSRL